MSARRCAGLAAGILAAAALGACGKSGPPLPPLRPIPGRVADATAHRINDDIELRFTVPPTNADGSTPAVVERVEIYGLSQPAATAPPTAAQLLVAKNLKGQVAVRRPPPPDDDKKDDKKDDKTEAKTPASTPAPNSATADLPLAGEPAVLHETIAAADHGADAPVRYYLVVAVAGTARRGVPSPLLTVPLATEPAAPADLAIAYDEHAIKLTWTAAESTSYRVYDGSDPKAPALSGAAPLKTAEFSTPVAFEQPRCFVVRAATLAGQTTIEGPPSEPKCVTPVDTFPPSAPGGLRAIAEDASVTLSWNALEATDVAGYIVLRGEGSGATLTPLMTQPTTATSYRDTSVTRGATYTYAVIAVDTAPAKNRSAPSNRETVTVR